MELFCGSGVEVTFYNEGSFIFQQPSVSVWVFRDEFSHYRSSWHYIQRILMGVRDPFRGTVFSDVCRMTWYHPRLLRWPEHRGLWLRWVLKNDFCVHNRFRGLIPLVSIGYMLSEDVDLLNNWNAGSDPYRFIHIIPFVCSEMKTYSHRIFDGRRQYDWDHRIRF